MPAISTGKGSSWHRVGCFASARPGKALPFLSSSSHPPFFSSLLRRHTTGPWRRKLQVRLKERPSPPWERQGKKVYPVFFPRGSRNENQNCHCSVYQVTHYRVDDFFFFFFPFWKKLFPCCGRVPGSQRRLWLDGHFINYKPPESESLCRMGPAIWSSTLYTIKAIVSALWLGYFKEPSATVEGNRCIFIPNSLGLFNPTMSRHLERLLLWFPFKRWGNSEIEELSVLFTKGF